MRRVRRARRARRVISSLECDILVGEFCLLTSLFQMLIWVSGDPFPFTGPDFHVGHTVWGDPKRGSATDER